MGRKKRQKPFWLPCIIKYFLVHSRF